MGMCRDLAETAMQLARQTAAKILNPQPEPAPQPRPQAPDPIQTFIRLATIIHKTIALECRIANGGSPRSTRAPQSSARSAANGAFPESPDPRRNDLKVALDFTTEKLPDRAARRRETHAQMDQKLAEYPQAEIGTLFSIICEELGLIVDWGRMPDHILKPLLPADFVQPTSFELPEGWEQHAYPHLHPARR